MVIHMTDNVEEYDTTLYILEHLCSLIVYIVRLLQCYLSTESCMGNSCSLITTVMFYLVELGALIFVVS